MTLVLTLFVAMLAAEGEEGPAPTEEVTAPFPTRVSLKGANMDIIQGEGNDDYRGYTEGSHGSLFLPDDDYRGYAQGSHVGGNHSSSLTN